jgi:hypothetical protein
VHGIGDVDAGEQRKCGVDGCEYQTKDKRHLKGHQAAVHGIGDVDAQELRRK